MSLAADDFSSPKGDTVKFDNVGDSVVGTITFIGDWAKRTNKFNGREEEVTKIVIATAEGDRALWPVKGTQLAQAIGDALRNSGAPALEVGGKLGLKLAELRDTGKPQKMKVYAGQYQAPAKTVAASDLF